MKTQQSCQKEAHYNHARKRDFKTGEQASVCNFRPGQCWLPGCVIRSFGPVSFQVKLSNGQVVKCHQDHIRKRLQAESVESPDCGDMADLTECRPVGLEDLPTKEDMTTPASHATAMSTATNSSPCDFTPSSLPQKPVPSTSGGQGTFRPHACLHCSLVNVVIQLGCAYLLTDIGIVFKMLLFNYS